MRYTNPLLVSVGEVQFQLSISREAVEQLIEDAEIVSVCVAGEKLVVMESVEAYVRRLRRAQRRVAAAQVSA